MGDAPKDLTVSRIDDPNIPEVHAVLTEAYTHNPTHVALLGADNYAANARLFELIMRETMSDVYAARLSGDIVGVIGLELHLPSERSRFSQLAFSAESLGVPESVIIGLQERHAVWAGMEPRERHVHVGPVAVLPAYQHKGVGGSLLDFCCAIVDEEDEIAYLETEGAENLRFYGRAGFEVIDQATLFGVPNYFMKRSPRRS